MSHSLTGLGGGGNKIRKLEWTVGAALAEGADTHVTTGAPQSNHARLTAAAAPRLGLSPVLVLGRRPQTGVPERASSGRSGSTAPRRWRVRKNWSAVACNLGRGRTSVGMEASTQTRCPTPNDRRNPCPHTVHPALAVPAG